VQTALVNARAALRSFASSVLGVAAKAFPDQWRGLKLTPPTLASWVGYDLDGRTDIHWSQSVAIRLREKAAQLTYYQGRIDAISEQTRSAAGLADMSKRLGKAADMAEQRAALFDADIDDPDTPKSTNPLRRPRMHLPKTCSSCAQRSKPCNWAPRAFIYA